MNLRDLLPGLDAGAGPAPEVRSLAYNSQRVEPGAAFFAIRGEQSDGHRFIPQALDRGAVAVVSEDAPPAGFRVPWVRVPAIRRALSDAARTFYRHPEQALNLVGITGTNGKTTTAYLIESILRAAGVGAGLFGTIEHHVAGRTLPAHNTTPESLDLVASLAELRSAGAAAAVMEVSSHALAQERVWGLPFAVALFTNLTRDHLDYHHTMEEYFRAKLRLFEGLGTPAPALGVINVDDPWGRRLLESGAAHFVTFGSSSEAALYPRRFGSDLSGLKATVVTPHGTLEIVSRLVGRPNLMNIIGAVAAAQGLGVSPDRIQEGVAALESVPGRFERVDSGQPFMVLVDYAHTDDALRNVLTTAREFARNRLMVVFGCGGDRDRSKRAPMGEAAGSLADLVVLTSDNPRSEDPLMIMNDALVGLQRTGKAYLLEVDRAAAIQRALERARAGDVVVIAGKGHETYQVLKDRTIAFDDRETAREALKVLGYPASADRGPQMAE
jgi:UDP-N-acetylmuramoyl-L-alanyl-D-glutamate--2,6-diaminopimelate ligase